jgi:CubicO group peptidase (beta-lactamase class C family)
MPRARMICVILLAGEVPASLGADAPRADGVSSQPVRGTIVATLDELVPRLMESLHVPGVSIVGIEGRRIAWDRHYGVRCAGRPEGVDRRTVFEACSMSKLPFAYVVLKAVERGKLDLDKPLADYLDKPYLTDQPLHKRITARMALSHTTGFPNWRKGGWEQGGPLPVLFEPGTRFGYSGEGFLYLQRVVEHITSIPLERYIQVELFKPLGMIISSYVWEDRFGELAAAGHDARGKPMPKRPLYSRANAGYSLYCTAYEYAVFLVEVLKDDRSAPHSLSARSIGAMLTRTTKATGSKPIHRSGPPTSGDVYRGLGWTIDETASGARFYHAGSNGTGFRCYCEFDYARGTGIAIMTNAMTGEALWRRVIEVVAAP